MMNITKNPAKYQGTNTQPVFTIEGVDTQTELMVDIYSNATVMSSKRFRGLETVKVNVEGSAMRAIDIEPIENLLGVEPLKGSANINIKCGSLTSDTVPITLAAKSFLSLDVPLTDAPQNITMPLYSALCVCFISAQKPLAYFNIQSVDQELEMMVDVVPQQGEGMYMATIDIPTFIEYIADIGYDPMEFFEAKLTIILGSKTIVRNCSFVGKQGTTLCWLNEYGAIDSYTFTPIIACRNNSERKGIDAHSGVTTNRKTVTVATPILPYEQLQWLSQIECSPKIWLKEGGKFRQIEIDKFSAEIKVESCSCAQLSIFIDDQTTRRV